MHTDLIKPASPELLRVGGLFSGQVIRQGKVVEEFQDPNRVVNEGLNALLNIMLGSTSKISNWYIGLYEGNYTPVAGVTAATIASASTETDAYAGSTRPAYQPAAAASQSISNSADKATFTFNASKTIYGAFLISSSTRLGTTGTLFAAARFSTPKSVDDGDEILLTYAFNAATAA